MKDYQWSWKDVCELKRASKIKGMECAASEWACAEAELEYWGNYLRQKFPDIKWVHSYLLKPGPTLKGIVKFSDGQHECLISGPKRWYGNRVITFVYFKTTKGAFRKIPEEYEPEEILPLLIEAHSLTESD